MTKTSSKNSERDFIRKVIIAGKAPSDVEVRSVMTKKVQYASPEDTVDECMSTMTQNRIRHLPVKPDRFDKGKQPACR